MPSLLFLLFLEGSCSGDLEQQGTDGQIYQRAALGSRGGIWNILVSTQVSLYL